MFDDFNNFSHAGFNQGLGGALAAYLTANQPKLAAQANYNQQQMDVQRHQQQVEQQRMQQMSQLLGQLNPTLGALYQGDPKNAGAIFQALQPTVKTNMLDEEIVRNPIDPLGGGTNQGQTNPNGLASYLNQQAPSMNSGMNNNQPSNIMPNQRSMPNKTVYERKLDIDRNSKKAEEADKQSQAEGDKIKNADDAIHQLGIFRNQLAKLDTRSLFKEGMIAPVADWAGNLSKSVVGNDLGRELPAVEAVRTVVNKMLLPEIEKMGGNKNFSDGDRMFLEKTLPRNVDTIEGQKRIADIAEIGYLRDKSRAEALRAYVKKYGNLDGFEEKWNNYSKYNDIFVYKPDGNFKINRSRIDNWKPYVIDGKDPSSLKMNKPAVQDQGTITITIDKPFDKMTEAEFKAARQKFGK